MRRAGSAPRWHAPDIGPLAFLGALLVGSALLRTSAGLAPALWTELGRGFAAHAEVGDRSSGDEVDVLLEELSKREARLDTREGWLDQREEVIDQGEAALRAQITELERAETEMRSLLKLADEAAQQDLDRLAAVYEAMKPDEAARLFEQMPPAFAAGFLGLMRPDTSAAILAGMPPETAYGISVMLAGRNADVSVGDVIPPELR